ERKKLAKVGIDIGDAVLGGNLSQVGDPGDAAGLVPLGHCDRGIAADVPVRAVINDEVKLRPVLSCCADVARVGVFSQARKFLFHPRWEKTFMDADVLDSRLLKLFVPAIS